MFIFAGRVLTGSASDLPKLAAQTCQHQVQARLQQEASKLSSDAAKLALDVAKLATNSDNSVADADFLKQTNANKRGNEPNFKSIKLIGDAQPAVDFQIYKSVFVM